VEEEDNVIAAQRALSGWRVIIAPRKPFRFDAVAKKLEGSGLRWTRRTGLDDPAADVLLLDSIGELAGTFEYADAVFMGGTLSEMGGHNILEPALAGKPVIAGPHLENFRDVELHFETHHAVMRIASGAELAEAVARAADDPELGQRGLAAARMQSGAAGRAAGRGDGFVRELVSDGAAGTAGVRVAVVFFADLACCGCARFAAEACAAEDAADSRGECGQHHGGRHGKTPVTLELVQDLSREGLSPRC